MQETWNAACEALEKGTFSHENTVRLAQSAGPLSLSFAPRFAEWKAECWEEWRCLGPEHRQSQGKGRSSQGSRGVIVEGADMASMPRRGHYLRWKLCRRDGFWVGSRRLRAESEPESGGYSVKREEVNKAGCCADVTIFFFLFFLKNYFLVPGLSCACELLGWGIWSSSRPGIKLGTPALGAWR